MIKVFRGHDHPDIATQVAGAMGNRGVVLGELGRRYDALGQYQEVIEVFGGHDHPNVASVVARGMRPDFFYNPW